MMLCRDCIPCWFVHSFKSQARRCIAAHRKRNWKLLLGIQYPAPAFIVKVNTWNLHLPLALPVQPNRPIYLFQRTSHIVACMADFTPVSLCFHFPNYPPYSLNILQYIDHPGFALENQLFYVISQRNTATFLVCLELNTSLLTNSVIRMLLYDLQSPEIPSLMKSIQAWSLIRKFC